MKSKLIGHEHARKRLKRLFAKKTIPHALLLSGTSGTGKKLVAIELYQSLFCETTDTYGGCKNCKPCLLLESGSLPNFTILDCRNKESAAVESIRSTLYDLNLKVSKGGSKILILDNSEYLPERSQNILLKALEEPRNNTYFCLITSSLTRVIKTIQSRCQTWHFDSLTTEQITQILKQNQSLACDDSPVDADLVARFADGSLENISQLLQGSESWDTHAAIYPGLIREKTSSSS